VCDRGRAWQKRRAAVSPEKIERLVGQGRRVLRGLWRRVLRDLREL